MSLFYQWPARTPGHRREIHKSAGGSARKNQETEKSVDHADGCQVWSKKNHFSAASDWWLLTYFKEKTEIVFFCVLDGRSAARESQRDRGPSGEHPPAEPRAAPADAHHRQLHSSGISGVCVCVCVKGRRCVSSYLVTDKWNLLFVVCFLCRRWSRITCTGMKTSENGSWSAQFASIMITLVFF